MFDRVFKRVNTFVDFRTDLVEGSSKIVGEELEQDNAKKQKVDDDKETTELKNLIEVMPDEEEPALDAIPLAVKSPSIVDWKIFKEGKKSYYQIIRADGTKYGSTRPVEDLDLVLYGDLKTMFEPHVEDNVWKNQSDYRVLDLKLNDSCREHSLRKQNVHIHIFLNFSQNSSRINEVFGSILLEIMKLLMKKLEILKKNIKFRGRLLGLKVFLKLLLLSQNRRDLPRDNPLVSVEVLSEDGNPARANIKQALGSYKDGDGVILFR
ncbi:hypothetical protein Tco_1384687 [Tanacetum coccineum]